jgi:hypothetical protein
MLVELSDLHALTLKLDPSLVLDELGFVPDDWQRAVMRSSAPRLLLNTARQLGKSSVCGALGLFEALYRPPALVLVSAPSLRQSGELYRKVQSFYDHLGAPVPAVQATASTMTLANGSRIITLPGSHDTIRGYSGPSLVLVDEASQTDDSLFPTLSPMLSVSSGRLIMLSTPFGCRGEFWRQWTEGGDRWERYEVPATACPRISPAFLDSERRTLGERWFRQEYMCSFEDVQDQCFSSASILAAFSSAERPLFAEDVA